LKGNVVLVEANDLIAPLAHLQTLTGGEFALLGIAGVREPARRRILTDTAYATSRISALGLIVTNPFSYRRSIYL
jgi:hypothetical protein